MKENDIEEGPFEIFIPMDFEPEEVYSKETDKQNYYKKLQERFANVPQPKPKKSENFQVTTTHPITFKDIGGYDLIKKELRQCLDILNNYKKYQSFNVRTPRGIIFEGPPGNGKTMIAKAFAGETNMSFISVSGSEFQEKYVGVGASRIRELFELASNNIPCIIFIDEIDALGRKRSSEGETAGSERDSTLNELLVSLDGFKPNSGVFVIGATNRVDLLDPALLRPGRIDKKIFIGEPDSKTREAILQIYLNGKPHDESIIVGNLVEITNGLSGAQIENLLNEAMLCALRNDREIFTQKDIDEVFNKIIAGWQPAEHQYTSDTIDRISVHEMGHAIVGLLSKHHSKMTKVVINLSSPKTPGYTIFEGDTNSIYTREALFEHLMILLAGRIAEELIYNLSTTTGAINDFEEALKLSTKMVLYYGMGKNVIYPQTSEKYKQAIDDQINGILNEAYRYSKSILEVHRQSILYLSKKLSNDRVLDAETIRNHLII
jgi:cell division protease FtsH